MNVKNVFCRAKKMDGGEWVSGAVCYDPANDKYYIINMTEDHISPIAFHQRLDPQTVGLYSGLHDKNDMRIFDGDIARVKYEGKIYIGVIQYDAYGVFIFVARNFGWIPLYKLLSDTDIEKTINHKPLNDYQVTAVEILGNIIDNDIEDFTGGEKK